jgi:phage shock protein C
METKRLHRSRTNRMLGGVCGGLAEYFGIDPSIVRVIFVLLSLPGGIPGPLIYFILWLVVPEE